MRPTLSRSLLALPLAFMGSTQTLAQTACGLHRAHYAPMKLPRLERKWTVAFTVDASRCATNSGSFSIEFTLWKENAPDTEFVETFQWKPNLNVISKEFWVDEAVGAYRVSERPMPLSQMSSKS